jgi:hypothetical protein
MAEYRIVCTLQSPTCNPLESAHIVNVGTGDQQGYSRLWTVSEVYVSMDLGNKFYTISPSSGKRANVYKYQCNKCGKPTLRSASDNKWDNNLDSLPVCQR